MEIHGGNIYRNYVNLDYSINVNPLGVPEAVQEALYQAVQKCSRYPDIEAEDLKKAVGNMLAVPEEYLLFGNGASELFMAAVHGLKPGKVVIPVPSFYGYEYAAEAIESEVVYDTSFYSVKHIRDKTLTGCELTRENSLYMSEDFFRVLSADVDLLFLANPNNPTGNLLSKGVIKRILQHCEEQGIYVVLDECFIEFSGKQHSMISEIEKFDNLILVRAFTKIFSIPGVRIGYLVCKNHLVLAKIGKQLPEWNLSCFAQEAGRICAAQTEYIIETEKYVKKERQFLEEGLKRRGLLVFPSMANFILFYSEQHFYEPLLKKGILIRDCGNFKGLGQGFYRIAVKSRRENEMLLDSLGGIKWEK